MSIHHVYADHSPHFVTSCKKFSEELQEAQGDGSFVSRVAAPFRMIWIALKGVIFEIPASVLLDINTIANYLNNTDSYRE